MSKLIKDALAQIIYKEDDKTDTRKGTAFFINNKGYFITARHCVDPRNINKFKVIYKHIEYSFKRIEDLEYSNELVDILIYRLNILEETDYIDISDIEPEKVDGNVRIYGFPNSKKNIKSIVLSIHGYEKDKFEITGKHIAEGYSGSPVYLQKDGKASLLIGVMSSTLVGKREVNYVYPISLIKKLNYRIYNTQKVIQSMAPCLSENSISFKTKFRLLAIKANEVSSILHYDIEHTFIEIEQRIKKFHTTYDTDNFWIDLRRIIAGFQKLLKLIAGDIAINLKLLTRMEEHYDKIFVQTVARNPSNNENENDRNSSEYFELMQEYSIDTLKEIQKKYSKLSQNHIRINSAYNYACFSSSKYWYCNNLNQAVRNNEYFSGSSNYEKFYSSLFVFTVYEKNPATSDVPLDRIKGLLIIDNIKPGSFDEDYLKAIGGYLAHRLNRFLSNPHLNKFLLSADA